MKSWPKQAGFTIVELLIVIVVIAILAAISVVADNGIQARAKNSKVITTASQYAKAIALYYTENSSLPQASCLGLSSDYPTSTLMAQNSCGNSGSWVINTNFSNAISPYIGSLPSVDASIILNNSDNSTYRRGAMYGMSSSVPSIWFSYIGSSCPNVSGLYNTVNTMSDSDSNTIHCRGSISGAS